MIDYRRFWGKARPLKAFGIRWHPVAWHLLDVAASVRAILEARPLTRKTGARLLQRADDEAVDLLTSLAVLHDLGKFAPCFQLKAPECWPDELGDVDNYPLAGKGHPTDGWMMWEKGIRKRLPISHAQLASRTLEPLILASFGHHGRPIAIHSRLQSLDTSLVDGPVTACLDALLPLVCSGESLSTTSQPIDYRLASWWVNGLLTMADWIGSNATWFPYETSAMTATEYWDLAQTRATTAVREAGLMQARSAERRSFSALTAKATATPMQRWAEDVPLPHGPLLMILEDVTGSGKTEAAQLLVHRLMVEGRASGAYWAMPTQATANAMYFRQRDVIAQLFAADARPSLVLAHSQARIHPQFRNDVLGSLRHGHVDLEVAADDADAPASSAQCSAWLADNRRASLVADVGAGTIDQALLGVLPSTFNTLRVTGLSDKVLVVDEAHAYDAYVSQELRHLLQLQSASGGHAIVLSATLREEDRRSLAAAWRSGIGRSSTPSVWTPSSSAFPLATVASGETEDSTETAIAAAHNSAHRLGFSPLHSFDDACALVHQACSSGAAVAWIRNTVTTCMETAQALRGMGLQVDVLHSRFTQGDRQRIEAELTRDFGYRATQATRSGRVVLATQVIEQSLDLDFDVMISDLAPMDLLLQRAGRLWRHRHRDCERGSWSRRLHVLMPDPAEAPTSAWPAPLLPGTAYVYSHANVLWNSAQLVASCPDVKIPEQSRWLIERAYGGDAIPEVLDPRADRARGTDSAQRETAKYLGIDIDSGYVGDGIKWTNDLHAPTRLADASVTLRLARRGADGTLHAWCDGYEYVVDPWAASEVRVRVATMGGAEVASIGAGRAEQQVVAGWSEYERTIPLIVLEPDDTVWRATVLVGSKRAQRVLWYDAGSGLRVERAAR